MATLTSSLVVRLINHVSSPARAVSRSLLGIQKQAAGAKNISFGEGLSRAITRNDMALNRARGGMVDATAGFFALREAIRAPVQAAMSFESSMADVKKVVDAFDTSTEGGRRRFSAFQLGLNKLSQDIPLATQELAEISAAAGEAGFAANELLQVTEDAAKMAVAFGSNAASTGAMLAAMQKSYGMSRDQAMGLADAMNHLSNNMASSAPKLMDFWTSIAADAQKGGFSQEQAVALGSAMIASGHGADVAATSFRNMVLALTRGEGATKRQAKALKRMGLDAGDVARRMQEDAVATTRDVLQRMSELPKRMRNSVSSDFFGNEVRALGSLTENLDFFEQALAAVAEQSEYAGSVFKEFETRAQTFGAETQFFSNRIFAMKVAIGSALIPALNELMDKLIPVIDGLTQFAQAHPELVSNITQAVAAVIGFKIAVSGLRFVGLLGRGGALQMLAFGFNTVGRAAIGASKSARSMVALQTTLAGFKGKKLSGISKAGFALRGIIMAIPGMAIFGGVMTAVGTALAAVGTAVAAITAPVWGAIAAAVLAVAAAGYAVWKYWGRISAVFSGVGRRISEELRPAFEGLNTLLSGVKASVEGRIRSIAEAMGFDGDKAVEGARKVGGRLLDALIPIRQLAKVKEHFKNIKSAISNALKGMFTREVLTGDEKAGFEQSGYDMADSFIKGINLVFKALTFQWGDIFSFDWKEAIPALNIKEWFDFSWVDILPKWDWSVLIPSFDLGDKLSVPKWLGGGGNQGVTGAQIDGAKASGGPVSAGGTYLVGEEGPELVTFGHNGMVHNAQDTSAMLRGLVQQARASTDPSSPLRAPVITAAAQKAAPPAKVDVNVGPITVNGIKDIGEAVDRIGFELENRLARAMRGGHIDGIG